ARLYVELKAQQNRLYLIAQHREIQEDALALTEDLLKIGNKNTEDLNRSHEQLLQINAKQADAEHSIAQLSHRLAVLVGKYPTDLLCTLLGSCELPALPCDASVGVPSELLRNRPDIRKAEHELAAALHLEDSAVASLYPR